jgi:hypothetical protein
MKRNCYSTAYLLLLAIASLQVISPSVKAQSLDRSRWYKVGAVGELEMSVPVYWQEVYKNIDSVPAVTLAYHLPSKKEFYMKVTTAWEPQQERSSRDPDWLRRAVEKTGRALLNPSAQNDLRLVEIRGPKAKGYYFQLPHRERFPIGEFSYITEGVVDLGKITVVFSTYSTTQDSAAVSDSLRVIESARFVQGNQ